MVDSAISLIHRSPLRVTEVTPVLRRSEGSVTGEVPPDPLGSETRTVSRSPMTSTTPISVSQPAILAQQGVSLDPTDPKVTSPDLGLDTSGPVDPELLRLAEVLAGQNGSQSSLAGQNTNMEDSNRPNPSGDLLDSVPAVSNDQLRVSTDTVPPSGAEVYTSPGQYVGGPWDPYWSPYSQWGNWQGWARPPWGQQWPWQPTPPADPMPPPPPPPVNPPPLQSTDPGSGEGSSPTTQSASGTPVTSVPVPPPVDIASAPVGDTGALLQDRDTPVLPSTSDSRRDLDLPPVLTREPSTLVADYDSDGDTPRPWSESASEERAGEHFRSVLARVAEVVGFDPLKKPPKHDVVSLSSLSGAASNLNEEDRDVKRLCWPWPKALDQACSWVHCTLQGKQLSSPPVSDPVSDKTLLPPAQSWIKPASEKLEWRTEVLGQWPITPPTACDVIPDFKPASSISIPRSAVLATEESIRRLTSMVAIQDHLFSAMQNTVRALADDHSEEGIERALNETADFSRLFAAASGRGLMVGVTAATNLQALRRDEALASLKSLSKEESARARSFSFLGDDLFGQDREALREYLRLKKEERASQAVLTSLSKSLQAPSSSGAQPVNRNALKGYRIPNKKKGNPFRGEPRQQQQRPFQQARQGQGSQRDFDRPSATYTPGSQHESSRESGRGRGRGRGRGGYDRNYHDKRNARGRFTPRK